MTQAVEAAFKAVTGSLMWIGAMHDAADRQVNRLLLLKKGRPGWDYPRRRSSSNLHIRAVQGPPEFTTLSNTSWCCMRCGAATPPSRSGPHRGTRAGSFQGGLCGRPAPDRALHMARPVSRRIMQRSQGPTAETTLVRRRSTSHPRLDLASVVKQPTSQINDMNPLPPRFDA